MIIETWTFIITIKVKIISEIGLNFVIKLKLIFDYGHNVKVNFHFSFLTIWK